MTKKITYSTCLSLLILLLAGVTTRSVSAQDSGVTIKGVVLESGSGLPLNQVSISVASTGTSAGTDENGEFTIVSPDNQAELIFNLPGYTIRNVFLNGRDYVTISLVLSTNKSLDFVYTNVLGQSVLKDANVATSTQTANELKMTSVSSFEQALQGKVAGLAVTEQSGMPGHKSYLNIRGISSLYGKSEPILFIDGMIHDYTYATDGIMEGFALNPFDIVDVNDISDIAVMKDGSSFLGGAGSNGVININTEQKSEASTIIQFSAYGGIALAPEQQDVLNVSQFKNYFSDVLSGQGYSSSDVSAMYPWLNGGPGVDEYYKYNNNTDWQNSIFNPSTLQKYHFFLKGGDDIATYNISTGYLSQDGLYKESGYNRFNLRINGKINITDKFSIAPNAKLALSNSYTPNQGYSSHINPLLSAQLMPPILAEYARDNETGVVLPYLDDVSNVFNVSNPQAIVQNAMGTNVNYNFLSSVKAEYVIGKHFRISSLFGLDFNNARESIFLPDLGIVQVDSAANSPGDFISEFRSTQNHSMVTYSNKTASGHSVLWNGGFRYMENLYKQNKAIDLNTNSDDFSSLGQGARYTYLRSTTGDQRGFLWTSYFSTINYNFRNKYFIDANVSYDGNSALNEKNRYNFYPSVAGAWRVSSERFMSGVNSWLDDLKLRGSWSVAGNMFSSVYDYSKLYYTSQRINSTGAITREAIPNEDMEIELKQTINAGLDLSLFKQALNIHADVYQSNVDNLLVNQSLSPTYGYTNYYNNGGSLETKGIELSADLRLQSGAFAWTLGGSFTKQMTEVTSLDFIDGNTNIITPIEGAELITSVGSSVYSFYGYETDGIYTSGAEANGVIGPNGVAMQEGDIIFVENGGQANVIDDNDKVIIGDASPDFYGGFFTTFAYDRFELSATFNYSVGNDIFNYVRYKTESMDTYSNQSATVIDRYSSANTDASLPRASIGDPTGNTVFSDRWIEDGSYLRLKKLTVSYKLPRLSGIYKGLTVYATATNLLTITGYSGYDPDFLYTNNPMYMGVDYGKMPQARSFILGLKLDL